MELHGAWWERPVNRSGRGIRRSLSQSIVRRHKEGLGEGLQCTHLADRGWRDMPRPGEQDLVWGGDTGSREAGVSGSEAGIGRERNSGQFSIWASPQQEEEVALGTDR